MNPNPSQRHRFATAVAMAGLLVAGAAFVVIGRHADAARAPKAAASPPPPPAALTVQTVAPQRQTLQTSLAASGSVQARDELAIGSDAGGVRLLEVTADVGARVKRGQLLARGDDTQLLAQLAQQDAQVRQARADALQAQANLDRAESVKDAGVYSTEALQTRRTAAEAAAARLELALAQRRELDARLAQTRVHAPADGVIARRTATVGTVMQPGVELFRLIRGGQVEWRAELPDTALGQVEPGARVRLRVDAVRTVEGRVRVVAPTVDARTRNGTVHVDLPAGTPLRPGSHAQGEIEVGQVQAWTLPEAVLLSRDGQPFVYVVGDHGMARAMPVQTGVRRDGRVQVLGLAPDARVVATGAGFVKDGERVQVAADGAPADVGS
ncbi:MAG: efflux RND transporter periplasmic adaptor subunit [Burkholderiaceae bacterium]|nr:efflux RND transporter periplasmic adaptor subunit [Burkholderiaceae bacterium]